VSLYDALYALTPGPIVALNRALAVAELHGLTAGRRALLGADVEGWLVDYHFLHPIPARLRP
jgi:RNA polymerase sigma-70 factor (ECF subfamily)